MKCNPATELFRAYMCGLSRFWVTLWASVKAHGYVYRWTPFFEEIGAMHCGYAQNRDQYSNYLSIVGDCTCAYAGRVLE